MMGSEQAQIHIWHTKGLHPGNTYRVRQNKRKHLRNNKR